MKVGSEILKRCLDDLESRIDSSVEDRLLEDWRAFLEGEFTEPIFIPRRIAAAPPRISWPDVHINDAQEHLDAMMLHQFALCSGHLASGSGAPLAVRSNYGTGIMPSLFGAKLFVMDRKLREQQTTRPLGGMDAIRAVLDRGVPDMEAGLGAPVFAAGRRFMEILGGYPSIGKYVFIYHPDMQGPTDICEMLWGSDFFLALIDHADLVHELLRLVTETYKNFMNQWDAIVPPREEPYSAHWNLLHKGRVMLRDDSAMNLSPEMYEEFIRPYDEEILRAFGGGAMHFCGRGDHYIESASSLHGLYAVHMSQPHLNDLEKVYCHTIDKGIPLLKLDLFAAEASLSAGRDLRGRVHCAPAA